MFSDKKKEIEYEQLRLLIESTEDSICLIDKQMKYLYANTKHLSRLKMSLNKIKGKTYSKFHSEKNNNELRQILAKVFKTKKSLVYELKSDRDGVFFLRTVSPVIDAKSKKINAVAIVSKNVTSLKEAELGLQEKVAEMAKLNQLMIGRELKMVELKNQLAKKL